MSNLAKTFTVFAVLYFAVHLITGYLHCEGNFCPGDRLSDYVYEYVNDKGDHVIVDDAGPVPKELYRQVNKEQ